MSVSWHPDRIARHARSQGSFGFYDSAYQIAVLPQEEVAPHVVVDHEITHVHILRNSSIGLLEQILVWLEWTAHLNGRSDVVTNVDALTNVILAATEFVHEAAAWFGTELQSEGHENIKAPATYAAEVKRLRRVFARMPDRPPAVLSKMLPQVLEIADAIAIYALSPPLMLALQPDLISPDALTTALARKPNNPLSRFRELCSRLENVPFPKVFEWARAINIEGVGGRPGAEAERVVPSGHAKFSIFARRDEMPVGFRSDLYKLGTAKFVQFVRALATHVGLLGSEPLRFYEDRTAIAQPDDEAVLEAFSVFDLTHAFRAEVDRYSQVCVLETSRVCRELVYEDEPDRVIAALGARPYLMLGVIRGMSSDNFTRGPEHITDVIVTAPEQGADPDGNPLSPTWRVGVATASPFLASYGWRNPIVASSVGYDFGVADYTNVKLLRDVPHVVVAIRDFRSLWYGVGPRGLRDCGAIEWMAMPSPSGRRHFGFLLLKPADNAFPIVVNPTLVSEYKRAVTVADRWTFKSGVHLVEHRGNPYAWMGSMTHAVMTAAAVFEMGASPEAVQMAALQHQMRESRSRLGL
jgi:hypothetical protein